MSWLRAFLKRQASDRGFAIKAMAKPDAVANFIREFRDQFEVVDLARAGAAQDGGYLIPDDLDGIEYCFSPGVEVQAEFELWLADKHGISSFLADASVDQAPLSHPSFDFEKIFLGGEDKPPFSTLESWMRAKLDLQSVGDMILQMDIEGAEFSVLTETSRDILRHFRIIVIEFHTMERLFDADSLPLLTDIFKKLYADFAVVHVHPNNVYPMITHHENTVPPIFEVTFLRRDRLDAVRKRGVIDLPHRLDAANVLKRPDVEMPEPWWKA
jgi:hypothetical protein